MFFNSMNEILEFAIDKEEGAAAFYRSLAKAVSKPWMAQAFEDFAKEEDGHRNKLLAIKEGNKLSLGGAKVPDMKVSDYVTDVEPHADMDYVDALVLAMKAEKLAFKLYSNLAATATDESVKALLLGLAQEEAKHKLRFEVEYDEIVNQEN